LITIFFKLMCLYSISNNVDNGTKVFYFGLESRLATSPFLINNPFNILFLLKGELLTEHLYLLSTCNQ